MSSNSKKLVPLPVENTNVKNPMSAPITAWKVVRISDPYFPTFGLKTERYGVRTLFADFHELNSAFRSKITFRNENTYESIWFTSELWKVTSEAILRNTEATLTLMGKTQCFYDMGHCPYPWIKHKSRPMRDKVVTLNNHGQSMLGP